MTSIERRPTLSKARVSDDVVAGLTGAERALTFVPAAPAQAAEERTRVAAAKAPAAPRRGPGRPRSRRRMEPFSSKIEISLRDDVDAYCVRWGESYVDLLDRALRAAIAQPPPGE
jgi:uncharacterized protein (DUF4415 family)